MPLTVNSLSVSSTDPHISEWNTDLICVHLRVILWELWLFSARNWEGIAKNGQRHRSRREKYFSNHLFSFQHFSMNFNLLRSVTDRSPNQWIWRRKKKKLWMYCKFKEFVPNFQKSTFRYLLLRSSRNLFGNLYRHWLDLEILKTGLEVLDIHFEIYSFLSISNFAYTESGIKFWNQYQWNTTSRF